MGYVCSTCGQEHAGLPFAYGAHAPLAAEEIPGGERDARLQLTSDQCIVDDERFFVRGRIPIRVTDTEETFYWGVWLEVSESQFDRHAELWEQDGRESEPSIDCTLATCLPCYPDTLGLKISLQTEPVGTRPSATVLEKHPLAEEQANGISLHRVKEIHDVVMAP